MKFPYIKQKTNQAVFFLATMSPTKFNHGPQTTYISLEFHVNIASMLDKVHCFLLSGSNGIQTNNHIVRKRALNHLSKLTK